MDTNFNFQRFLSVARWDLTINKTFYSKAVMLILGCVLLPVVLPEVLNLAENGLVFRFGRNTLLPEESIRSLESKVALIALLCMVIIFVAAGYTFHNLRYRQGRIMELTLPASNLERFLWHNVLVFLCTLVVIVLSILLADAAHVFLAWAIHGKTVFHSISLLVWNGATDVLFMSPSLAAKSPLGFLLLTLPSLWLWNFVYTFSFINAWKYRYNIGYTLLFHILWWIVGILLMTVISVVLAYVFVDKYDSDSEFFNLCLEYLTPSAIQQLLFLFTISITCLLFWLTYRLYCRAQLTTKRNP